jgi:hypothetical protein
MRNKYASANNDPLSMAIRRPTWPHHVAELPSALPVVWVDKNLVLELN